MYSGIRNAKIDEEIFVYGRGVATILLLAVCRRLPKTRLTGRRARPMAIPDLNGIWEAVTYRQLEPARPLAAARYHVGNRHDRRGASGPRCGRGRRNSDTCRRRWPRRRRISPRTPHRRSRSQVLHARHSARQLHAVPVPDRPDRPRHSVSSTNTPASNRLVNMGKPQEAGSDTWMGTNNGHWEGDTLVIDVTGPERPRTGSTARAISPATTRSGRAIHARRAPTT